MNRATFWSGLGLLALGVVTFLAFVLPAIGDATSNTRFDTWLTRAPGILAVAVASLGMAGGAALLGISLGRWRQPKSSPHDGSPEI